MTRIPLAPRIPLFAAPMFLITGTRLVQTCRRYGLPALIPALNARTIQEFRLLLEELTEDALPGYAPYGVSVVLHDSNPRAENELLLCEEFRVPIVVTGLGNPAPVVPHIRRYGGWVFHEATTVAHAEKAAAAGADGIILICAGAGGHTGSLSPFAFVPAVRRFYRGKLLVAGAITDGAALCALQALGADYGYAGTLFIACLESLTPRPYREMILRSRAEDLVVTSAVSGAPASLLRKTLDAHVPAGNLRRFELKAKAWRDIWSAGQGIENINRLESVEAIISRLELEYEAARRRMSPPTPAKSSPPREVTLRST